ncbi:MAG: hypothetical protein WBB11_04605 [Ferruginibacter sp.]
MAYLQSIVANKANYIEYPFSLLKSNLQIEIKFFQPFAAIHFDKNKETSTSFVFYFPPSQEEIYLIYPCVEIYWQTPLDITQFDEIRRNNNNRGQWNSSSEANYSNAIVKDIQIRE